MKVGAISAAALGGAVLAGRGRKYPCNIQNILLHFPCGFKEKPFKQGYHCQIHRTDSYFLKHTIGALTSDNLYKMWSQLEPAAYESFQLFE